MLVTALDRIYPGWRRPYRWWTPFIGVIEWIMQNITLTSIHSDSTGPTHLSCVRGILFYGLVKHAVAIDLHPRDLLSEKSTGSALAKCQPCAALQPKARNRAAWLGFRLALQ